MLLEHSISQTCLVKEKKEELDEDFLDVKLADYVRITTTSFDILSAVVSSAFILSAIISGEDGGIGKDFLDVDLQQIARESRQEMLQTPYNCYEFLYIVCCYFRRRRRSWMKIFWMPTCSRLRGNPGRRCSRPRTTAMSFYKYSLLLFQEKKEELDEDFLDADLQQIARESRQEMLQTAYNCYKNASECEDEESEEWLTQYMMGKSVEKMKREPLEYLEHYRLVGMAHTVHDGKKC